jgi:periplasmic protein TonB
MFEDATFHSRSILSTQTPKWMLLTLAGNLTIVAALIVYPLINPESLPSRMLQQALFTPPPVPSARPQTHTSQPASVQTLTFRDPFAAPTVIPPTIRTDPSAAPPTLPFIDLNAPSVGVGVDGPSTSLFHTSPRPVVHPVPTRVSVSGGVIEGYVLHRTVPVYPVIARTVGVSGTVTLAATISKTGGIENLRVISGHPMLRQAAIDAVQTWRYRPYLLNSEPVEVQTTINVVFNLGNR